MNENASGSLQFESPDEENSRLREENARLRRALAVHGIPIPPPSPPSPPPANTVDAVLLESKDERARKRIALFRDLFHGRDDVYARRWESADGRSGYVPAALKDWKAINKRGIYLSGIDEVNPCFGRFIEHSMRFFFICLLSERPSSKDHSGNR